MSMQLSLSLYFTHYKAAYICILIRPLSGKAIENFSQWLCFSMLRKCLEWAFSHRSKKGSIKLVAAVFRSINTLYTFMYSLIDGHKMLNGFAASKVRKR